MTEEQVVACEERAALESAYIMSHLNAQDIDRRTLPQSKARSPTHDAADDERRLIVAWLQSESKRLFAEQDKAEERKSYTVGRDFWNRALALLDASGCIEAGEHRSKP